MSYGERKDFEEWYQSVGQNTDRTEAGDYLLVSTEAAWSGWMASRKTNCKECADHRRTAADNADWHSGVSRGRAIIAEIVRSTSEEPPHLEPRITAYEKQTGSYAVLAFSEEALERTTFRPFRFMTHREAVAAIRGNGVRVRHLTYVKLGMHTPREGSPREGVAKCLLISGGISPVYYADVLVLCEDGATTTVVKNRISGSTPIDIPDSLHSTEVPFLEPTPYLTPA